MEQTESHNSFPFDIDNLMTVKHQYDSEQLTQINIKRNGIAEYTNSVIYEDGAFLINFNEDNKGFDLLRNVL
ncbi:MAG: hypothetical protein M9888_12000 [Chitinophagales bacterium]|nr:hypothetical protein [Chitinophagales bacterium]